MDTALQRALAEIEPSALELLRELVRHPTLGPTNTATREALGLLAAFLRQADIDVDIAGTGIRSRLPSRTASFVVAAPAI